MTDLNTDNIAWLDRPAQERAQIHINEVSKDICNFAEGLKNLASESSKMNEGAQLCVSNILDSYKKRLTN